MLSLRPVDRADVVKAYEALQQIPKAENGFQNPYFGMEMDAFYEHGIESMLGASQGVGLPIGYVPQTFCFLWEGGQIVGLFKLRAVLSGALRVGSGHVGYAILPMHREKGFATEGLRLAIEKLMPDIEEAEVYLSCDLGNVASLRVQLKNGAYVHHADEAQVYTRIPLDAGELKRAQSACENPLCRAIREQTKRALWEIDNVFSCIPAALSDQRYCDQPLWKHVYHTLHSLDRWLINPCDPAYEEPPFHEAGMNDLNAAVGRGIGRDRMEAYRAQVSRKAADYLASLTDRTLNERPEGCEHTRFTLILAQHRHLHTHMGMLMGFIAAETGLWPRVLGLAGAFPQGEYERYM